MRRNIRVRVLIRSTHLTTLSLQVTRLASQAPCAPPSSSCAPIVLIGTELTRLASTVAVRGLTTSAKQGAQKSSSTVVRKGTSSQLGVAAARVRSKSVSPADRRQAVSY